MRHAIESTGLGKRYRKQWALTECCLHIPAGRITALVGRNGAGKTTLLKLAVGLLAPDAGRIEVLGWSPVSQPTLVLSRVGYVPQDRPLYQRFTVADMLRMGRELNPRWDDAATPGHLEGGGIPLDRQIRQLSGAQQAQVSLALALGKCPDLLLLGRISAVGGGSGGRGASGRRSRTTSLGAAADRGRGASVAYRLVMRSR